MAIFEYDFSPARNQQGLSELMFLDYQPDTSNMEQINLRFNVKGLVERDDKVIFVGVDIRYDPYNKLGQTLKAMGFKPDLKDEDGFEQFEKGSNLGEMIECFLKSRHTARYKAKISKIAGDGSLNFWNIDIKTLVPIEGDNVFDQLPKLPIAP